MCSKAATMLSPASSTTLLRDITQTAFVQFCDVRTFGQGCQAVADDALEQPHHVTQ